MFFEKILYKCIELHGIVYQFNMYVLLGLVFYTSDRIYQSILLESVLIVVSVHVI